MGPGGLGQKREEEHGLEDEGKEVGVSEDRSGPV